jgi:uncharacterized protein (DUF427 family)
MAVRAVWKGQVLAESDATVVVEGNHYFPPESVRREYFSPSATHSTCPWKGEASYYSVNVDDAQNADAAWYYPQPKAEAEHIRDYVAFWHGVVVETVPAEAAL